MLLFTYLLHQMENISNFLKAAEAYGCDRGDLFQSVYLQEGQNMPAVIGGIQALGRKVRIKRNSL